MGHVHKGGSKSHNDLMVEMSIFGQSLQCSLAWFYE